MFYFLVILLSILGEATITFGRVDHRDVETAPVIAIEDAYPGGPRTFRLQSETASYRLKNEKKWGLVIQESDAPSVCFQEMQVGDRPERERWLNRYIHSSLCRAKVVQGRAFPKQASVSLATAILLLFLVGTMGTAALLSAQKNEPLKPWMGAVAKTE